MYNGRFLVASAVLALGLSCCPAWGASPHTTLTMSISGNLGKILAGKDPIGGTGKSGVVQVAINESLSPVSHTATSVTYKLPPGSVSSGGSTAKGGPTTMKISMPASGPVTINFSGSVTIDSITSHVTATVVLEHGSFPSSIFKHPVGFKSPQTLSPAKTSGGAGSKVSYTAPFNSKTVLALGGTVSD
jgi:hypothetical protein